MTKNQTDIAYGTDPLQKADLYFPAKPNGAALVFAHGGGWFRGDKSRDADLGQRLADAGYLAVVANYRLAPANLFPAAQNDFDQCVEWLAKSDYEFDHDKIGLLGASVGGTMAITNSLTSGRPTVTWSAIIDFANWVQKHQMVKASVDAKNERGETEIHAIHDAFYKYFIQTYLGDLTPQKLTAVNPMNHLTETLGPTLMFNSTDELAPLPSALHFIEQAAVFGRDITVHVVPGSGHARDYTDFAMPGTLSFFDHHLLGPTA